MSSALPYMQFYIADYLADTTHLSTVEHGAYMLLIMNYWQRGAALPNDDAKLARIARLPVKEWLAIRDVIAEFFTIGNEVWQHKRVELELNKVRTKAEKARNAGLTSAQHRANKKSTDVDLEFQHGANGRSTDVASKLQHGANLDPTIQNRTEQIQIQNREEDKGGGADAPAGKAYAFEGAVIKVSQKDFDKWTKDYFMILDLPGELTKADAYLVENPPKDGKWFFFVVRWLAREHAALLKESKPLPRDHPDSPWYGAQ